MASTVFITGGSRGIGAACVRLFAQAGWGVAFTYRDSYEAARALAGELPNVLALQGDMTCEAEVRACYLKAKAHFGAVHALVCNAGKAEQSMFADISDEAFDRMFASNVKSAVYAVRQALPEFVHRKKGSIVMVSSVWGIMGASCESHYAASKAALIGLSKSLAQELGPSGIRVNCVAPGVIDTDMNRMHDSETMDILAQETPLGRIGTAEEVAQSILFLSCEKAGFITGQVLGVSGGFAI